MSTRATLIYIEDKGFHVYHELLDNTVHVEIEKPGMVVDVEIVPFDQWVSLDLPTGIINGGITPRAADDGDALAESELSNDEMDDTFEII